MLLISSGEVTLLFTVTFRSCVAPTHTDPKLPVSTTLVTICGAPPLPLTLICRAGVVGSLLLMVRTALLVPKLVA